MNEATNDVRLGEILERTDFWNGEGTRDLLLCPECGHEYTHLDQTVVYQRSEDAITSEISVDSFDGVVIGTTDNNPSPRRDAVVLHFEGECGHRFTVTFCQHKGNTYTWAVLAELEGDE